MKSNLIFAFLFFNITILLTNCATQRTSTIIGGEYEKATNKTEYFVLPIGSVSLPGKWEKTQFNSVSRQQFFKNQDSVIIAIAFNRYNNYEFNTNGSFAGYNFVKAYYEWDSKYFVESHGLNRESIINDSINNYMIYRIFGKVEKGEIDTYFLIGEKNGNISNFSVSKTKKWSEAERIDFLKNIFLTKKIE